MKNIIYRNLKALTLCAGFFSLAACKEKSIVKPDLIPDVDGINVFEAKDFTMSVRNEVYDSLVANSYDYPVVVLGQIASDSYFGHTQAGVYMQFIPPIDYFTFPDNVKFDSVVLVVPYMGYAYGDTSRTDENHALHLRAYRINDPNFTLGDGTTQWNISQQFNTSALLGEGIVSIKSLTDTLYLANGDTSVNLLRLKLNTDFVRNFTTEQLATYDAFQSAFHGIYLAPDTTKLKNTLAYFAVAGGSDPDYVNQTAHFKCYYHTDTDTTLKEAAFSYSKVVSTFSNYIGRNYNGTPAAAALTQGSDSVLVQGSPGFRSIVTINLGNKIPPAVINKAALTITLARTGDHERFSPPPQLSLTRINDDNTVSSIADILDGSGSPSTGALDFIDGKPKVVTINGESYFQYTINLPREIQRTLSAGENSLRLRITTSQLYPAANRMVGYGTSAPDPLKMKFNVIYTLQK